MSEPKKDEVKEEAGAQERFDNAVANALKMPPKPHVKREKPKPAPRSKASPDQ